MASYTEQRTADTVGDHAYQYSRSLRGVPSAGNRQHRATVDSWKRGLSMTRTVGTGVGVFGEAVFLAEGTLVSEPGEATVKVTLADGTVEYRPVSQYRAERTMRRQATQHAESHAEKQARRDFELQAAMGSNHEGDV